MQGVSLPIFFMSKLKSFGVAQLPLCNMTYMNQHMTSTWDDLRSKGGSRGGANRAMAPKTIKGRAKLCFSPPSRRKWK